MEKNITKMLPSKVSTTGNIVTEAREEKASVSQPKNPENCDKKVSLSVTKQTDIPILTTLAQDEPAAVNERTEADLVQEEEEELIVLRVQSSDEEIFEDAVEDVAVLEGKKMKVNAQDQLEKYFSDIESSDDSQGYEPKYLSVDVIKSKETVPDKADVEPLKSPENIPNIIPNETITAPKYEVKDKGSELELEPVESDEEDFECSTAAQQEENVSTPGTSSKLEEYCNEDESFEMRSTPLFDEQDSLLMENDMDETLEELKVSKIDALTSASVVGQVEDDKEIAVAPTLLEENVANELAQKEKQEEVETVKPNNSTLTQDEHQVNEKPMQPIDIQTTLDSRGTSAKGQETEDNKISKSSLEAAEEGSGEEISKIADAEDKVLEIEKPVNVDIEELQEKKTESEENFSETEKTTKEDKSMMEAEESLTIGELQKESVKSEDSVIQDAELPEHSEEPLAPSDEIVEPATKNDEPLETGEESLEISVKSQETINDPTEGKESQKKSENSSQNTETANEAEYSPEAADNNLKTASDDVKSLTSADESQENTNNQTDVKPSLNEAGRVSENSLKTAENSAQDVKLIEAVQKSNEKNENDSTGANEFLEKSEISTNAAVESMASTEKPNETEKMLETVENYKKTGCVELLESVESKKNVEELPKAEKSQPALNKIQVDIEISAKDDKTLMKLEQTANEATKDLTKNMESLKIRSKSIEQQNMPTEILPEREFIPVNDQKSEEKNKNEQERTTERKNSNVAEQTERKGTVEETMNSLTPIVNITDAKNELKAQNEINNAAETIVIEFAVIEIDDDNLKCKDNAAKHDGEIASIEEKKKLDSTPAQVIGIDDANSSKQPVKLSSESMEKRTGEEKSSEQEKVVENLLIANKIMAPSSPEEVEMLEIIDTTDNEETADDNVKQKEEPIVKDDTTMKSADNCRAQDLPTDDEEPLLVIDTAHKEDNENEENDMDTETEQTATSAPTTDSSSDGSLEVFYDKQCVNYECKRGSKNFYQATLFSLNYYKISKKRSKSQFVCEDCYDRALDSYEEMCRTLKQKQPLLLGATFKRQEFVEIIDSSDEEDGSSNGEKVKELNALPKESIEMLEAELEGAIRKVMHNVEIQNQLSWTKQILQQRLYNLEEDAEFVSEQLRLLQKKADGMHNSLYQCPKIKIRQLTPLDLNSGRSYNPETESTIPPIGDILRTSIHINETYYAVKNKAIASWVPCTVIEAIDSFPSQTKLRHYKIKFLKSKYPLLKTVSAKHMAFFNPPKVRLPIGTRVIAYFDATSLSRGKEKMLIPSAFYPGIIAEPLKQSNKFRYLVFYDDGYFQYVYHKDVRLVCQASEHVWDDVHHQSREFIHNYLTQYAVNRPMVQTQKGQSMLVDYNGKWIYARVIDVDCSLVQMLFEGQSRSEWIYRGSTRLGPVYKESNNFRQKNLWSTSRISRRTEPYIRYFNGDDSSSTQQQQESQQHQPKAGEVRSVAKKSVSRTDTSHSSQPPPTVRHLNNSTIFVDDDNKPKGKVVYYTARKNLPPRDYVSHICNPSCPFTVTHNLMFYSPLAKPLLSGWERQVFRQKSKKFIVYRGPCGKRMRTMEELHRYLRVTENELNVDNFDFSADTNCLAEYVIESCIVQKKDISNGKEKMPIPCVNYYDNTMPPDCIYSSRRIPTEGVPLNLDREFLVGCDCEDDCSDKSKCSCWNLTYAGAKYGMPNVPNEMVGYQYKRLYEHVPTGIYECNSRCKCKANCVNRVVQQPLQSKLQVFKTSNRGWGLRCINDVPRGSFICIYAGHLLTEQKANEGGLDAGDEYFAELDYIEVAEQIKEGYESDIPELDEDEDIYNPNNDDDDEFVAPGESQRNKTFNTRLRTRRSTKNSTDAEHDSQERQVISFEPKKKMGQLDNSTSEKQTIRKLFGKDEACYIMDAKITGNLGRYFNHSCSPNLFVQNVFVDTHDLRFPWVAFFAFTHIRAGTELTWNYNYEVGVVPGKVLYCQCGAPNCRQRLL